MSENDDVLKSFVYFVNDVIKIAKTVLEKGGKTSSRGDQISIFSDLVVYIVRLRENIPIVWSYLKTKACALFEQMRPALSNLEEKAKEAYDLLSKFCGKTVEIAQNTLIGVVSALTTAANKFQELYTAAFSPRLQKP